MRFVDTNVFLRHLLNDHPEQSPACFEFIQAIEQSRIRAWTSDLVIAELVFVLASKQLYNLGPEEIRDLLLPIIGLPGLRLPHKRLYHRVFELYTSLPIDFIDAYHAAHIESQDQAELYSYDEDFDRVEGVHRLAP